MSSTACFHCQEPLAGATLLARIGERQEAVCCAGCLAVAELIAGSGLADFYEHRSAASQRPASVVAEDWPAYADPAVAAEFLKQRGTTHYLTLIIQGLRCSACSWLIEHTLRALPGVERVTVNAATGRAQIEWQRAALDLPRILSSIAQLGYRPRPLTAANAAQVQRDERRSALKQLMVAAFGMMQVMMFAVGGYAAELNGETLDPALASISASSVC